jgi:hypothetical protein
MRSLRRSRQFAGQLEFCIQWGISDMLHDCARRQRENATVQRLASLERWARKRVGLEMPLGFTCIRAPRTVVEEGATSSPLWSEVLSGSPAALLYSVEGDEVRVRCESRFPAKELLCETEVALLALYGLKVENDDDHGGDRPNAGTTLDELLVGSPVEL